MEAAAYNISDGDGDGRNLSGSPSDSVEVEVELNPGEVEWTPELERLTATTCRHLCRHLPPPVPPPAATCCPLYHPMPHHAFVP